MSSILGIRNYYYHFFGWAITSCLFIFFLIVGVFIDPERRDKGQIIAHILFLKTAALMVYPSRPELIDYCSGFMMADLPMLNSFFGSRLSDPRDLSPAPYRLFFTSLSLSSTYLLALAMITAIALCLGLALLLASQWRKALGNAALFFYCFFVGGLAFAAAACVQGALINFADEFTRLSAFYLLGVVAFLALLGEALWSCLTARRNVFKLRVLAKASLLCAMHLNPLYLFSLVLGAETFFVLLEYRLVSRRERRLWLTSNVLPNLALFLLVEFSSSLFSIYASAILIIITLLFEATIAVK